MHTGGKSNQRAFNMIEMLAVVVIMGIMIAATALIIPKITQRTKSCTDKSTLAILNDALNQYKLIGGDVSVFTEGTPAMSAVERLLTPLERFGNTHKFLQPGRTYQAASIDAAGYGAFYRFTRFDTYELEGSAQTQAPPQTPATSQDAIITYLQSFTPTLLTSNGSGSYEMSWDGTVSWQTLGAYSPVAAGDYSFYVRNAYVDDNTNMTESGPHTLTVQKANQVAVASAGDSITVGTSFTPSTTGGSGTGGWQMYWSDIGSWQTLAGRTLSSEGDYTFWIRKEADSNYNISNEAGTYTLSVTYDETAWETDAQTALPSGNHWTFTQPASSTVISMDVRTTTDGGEIWVWWGDGTHEILTGSTGSDTTLSHTYSSAATYSLKIYGDITRLVSRHDDGRTVFGGDISTIPTLTYVDVGGSNTLSGSVAGLTGLTRLAIEGANTVSGSVSGLTSLTYLKVRGSNTITGSVAGLTGLTTLYVEGSNTLSGDVAGLTSCTYLNVEGSNTLSGDISAMTQLTTLSIGGNNTIDGSVANLTNLTYMYAWGANTLYGSLANLTGLTYLNIRGSNDITGSIANLTSLTYLYAAGDNAISGDISALTQLTYVELWSGASVGGSVTNLSNLEVLICGSAVTVTGSVAGKPIGKLNLYSNTSIDEASIVSLSGTSTQLCYLRFASGYTMSSAQVDTVLQNMWNNSGQTKYDSDRFIYMKYGNIEAPTATGETYIANLEGAGWSVTTY